MEKLDKNTIDKNTIDECITDECISNNHIEDNYCMVDEFVITVPNGYIHKVKEYINNKLPYKIDSRTTIVHPGIVWYHRISPIQVLPSKDIRFKIRAIYYQQPVSVI